MNDGGQINPEVTELKQLHAATYAKQSELRFGDVVPDGFRGYHGELVPIDRCERYWEERGQAQGSNSTDRCKVKVKSAMWRPRMECTNDYGTRSDCKKVGGSSLKFAISFNNIAKIWMSVTFFLQVPNIFVSEHCSDSCIPVFKLGKSKAVSTKEIPKRPIERLWSSF